MDIENVEVSSPQSAEEQYELASDLVLKENEAPGVVEEAMRLYTLAANQGHVKAQEALGTRYVWGMRVPEDKSRGLYWFRRAANLGSASAWVELAIHAPRQPEPGYIAPRVHYYTVAAHLGSPQAMLKLSEIYEFGEDVHIDLDHALLWAKRAASHQWATREHDRLERLLKKMEVI